MTLHRYSLLVVFFLQLAFIYGCVQQPLPLQGDAQEYVGIWEQGTYDEDDTYVYLQINAAGYLSYAHMIREQHTTYCMAIMPVPIQEISADKINASLFWKFSVDFEINRPPGEVNGVHTLVIDGHELIRTSTDAGVFEFEVTCDDGLVLAPATQEPV